MAESHLNNIQKVRVYRSLYHINRLFEDILFQCRELDRTGIFRPNQMLLHRGMVREMQANISHDIADKMHEVEDQDWFLFGKARMIRDTRGEHFRGLK